MNNSKISLLQMQKYFEGQVDSIRTISDLQLSENDYRSLGAKLKSLTLLTGSEGDVRDFMLTVAVYSVYSLIYDDKYNDFSSVIRMILHENEFMKRLYLHKFKETYDIYGLGTFGISTSDLKSDCRAITARHAGVPNSEKNYFFDVVSMYLQYDEIDNIYTGIYENLPPRTRYIFELMDERNRRSLLIETRMLVCDAISGQYTRDDILYRYPEFSFNIVDYCIMWNESRAESRIKNYN